MFKSFLVISYRKNHIKLQKFHNLNFCETLLFQQKLLKNCEIAKILSFKNIFKSFFSLSQMTFLQRTQSTLCGLMLAR